MHLHNFSLYSASHVQVWSSWNAVCSVLGEQLLWHAGLHPLCLLHLHLHPIPPHTLLLHPDLCRVWERVFQVCRVGSGEHRGFHKVISCDISLHILSVCIARMTCPLSRHYWWSCICSAMLHLLHLRWEKNGKIFCSVCFSVASLVHKNSAHSCCPSWFSLEGLICPLLLNGWDHYHQ